MLNETTTTAKSTLWPRFSSCLGGMLLAWLCVGPAHAADRIVPELGVSASDSIAIYRLAWQRDWERRWFTAGEWFLGGYWEVNLGYWKGEEGKTGNSDLFEVGVVPVFRLQRHQPLASGMRPYVEFAVGAHLLSETKIEDRELGSAFQFGDHIGVGALFGKGEQFDLGFRLQHISNAGLKEPNDGINVIFLAHLGYRF